MKKIIGAVLLVLLMISGAGAKDFEVTKKAGDYNVVIKMDRNPPIAGDNNLTAVVKDAAGLEVKDAKVSVEYSMAAMPGMPAAKYKTDAESKGGEHKAKLNFSMAGGWSMAIKIVRGGKTSQAKFNLDVR